MFSQRISPRDSCPPSLAGRAVLFSLLLWFINFGGGLFAQNLKVEVPLTLMPGDGRRPAWVVKAAPQAGDIKVGDQHDPAKPHSYATGLAAALTNSAGNPPNILGADIQNWAKTQGHQIHGAINNPLATPSPTPAEVAAGTARAHSISFVVGVPAIREVRIYIISPTSKSGKTSYLSENLEISPLAHYGQKSLGEIMPDYDLALSSPPDEAALKNTYVTYIFSAADGAAYPKDSGRDPKKALEREYEAVAASYTAYLHEKGIRPGQPAPANLQEIRGEANDLISNLTANTGRGMSISADGVLSIVFEDVGPPTAVDIDVTGDSPRSQKLEEWYNRRYLLERSNYRLVTTRDHIFLRDAVESDLKYLQESEDLASARWQRDDRRFQFIVTPQERMTRQLKFAAGLAYSEEKSATAQFTADFSDATEADDRLKLSLEGGDRALSGEGEIDVPLGHDPWAPRLLFSLGSEKLDETYYGNLTRGAVESTRFEGRAGVRFEHDLASHYDRYEAERALRKDRERWGQRFLLETGLRYTDVSLDGTPAAVAGLDDGDTAGPYLSLGHQAEFDARTRAGSQLWQRFLIDTRLDLDSGFESLAGTDDYARSLFQSNLRAVFRSGGEIAGYALLGVTGGWASDDTPTYQSFGAGGSPFVRGLQEDEFIGRCYLGGTVEAGVNLKWLASRGARRSDANGTTRKPLDKIGPLSLQETYFAAFADIGELSDRTEDGAEVAGSRGLQGYGVQLQVMNSAMWDYGAALAVGYAWSPQSRIHESGTVFTKVSFEF